jgi:phosphotransferase family enzyme
MHAEDRARAVAAVRSIASSLGLRVEDAVVLSDSNRLVLHLLPSDIVARVASVAHFASAALEIDLATQLAGCPIAGIDPRVAPRVFVGDDFEITFWEHFEPVPARTVPAAEYMGALVSLHAGLRRAAISAPHVRDRIVSTLEFVTSRDLTPDLADNDRTLLTSTMRDLGESIVAQATPEQLLHGEPHPWNLLDTNRGVQFIDFENTCLGPLEYDLAWVPDDVAARYPDVDRALLGDCRAVVLAIIAAHRWSRDDRHPSGRRSGHAFLDALRHGPPWPTLDQITW